LWSTGTVLATTYETVSGNISLQWGSRLRERWVVSARTRWAGVARTLLVTLPLLAVWATFLMTGLYGVDYGYHWDEVDWHIKPVRQMVADGVLLPKSYIYPTLTKWLVLVPALPAGISAAISEGRDPARIQEALLAAMDAPGYLLSVRRLYIFISSLGILWTYGAALALKHRWWQALIAAAALGLSWEVAYHARYVNTDCILLQFSALTMLGLAVYLRTGRTSWLHASAVFAGLCAGTKYNGVFLLLSVVAAVLVSNPPRTLSLKLRRVVEVCAIAFAVYLFTTPATVLDPFLFLKETRHITSYYASVKHGGYTVESSWVHAKTVFLYFTFAFFSAYRVMAVALFALAFAGIGVWFRRDFRSLVVLGVGPVAFLTTFIANYLMVTVRNYLFLTPVLCLALAWAAKEIAARIPQRAFRWPLAGLVSVAVLFQGEWLIRAAKSIRNMDPKAYVRDAVAYVREHPERRFRVSARVSAIAAEERLVLPENMTQNGNPDAVVFFAPSEGPKWFEWKTNDPWMTEAVFGPLEVNFNWYASWSGHDRVVVMTMERAKAAGAPISQ
jgi:hypothetical protein